jgi:hypothetical protein
MCPVSVVLYMLHPRVGDLVLLESVIGVYHSSDQVKKTELGRTCGTYGGEERCIQGFSRKT